ncbi:hypothetical protein ACFB49_48940 [Sphingomonas sp. DBB INV C78]|uniref:DsrE family protein n=1 Tax=Sphingomonas sp. DBB INV C78 TaxID=3349434 RepID=UPI0036D20A02
MTGLTIIVATADAERFRTALTMALTQAALGGRTRLFLQDGAVALLRGDDADQVRSAGLPDRAFMLADALDAGVEMIGCQTGLALINAAADEFDARIGWAGMVSLLQTLDQDRLVVV